ncbi:MAG: hypothetical protein H7095_06745 [Pseudopedobacter sp.]|nr:hypothetical protein [Deinococcales bacterium]
MLELFDPILSDKGASRQMLPVVERVRPDQKFAFSPSLEYTPFCLFLGVSQGTVW